MVKSSIMKVCILNDNFYRGSGITLVIRRLAESASFREVDLYLAGCGTVTGHTSFTEDTGFVPPDNYRTFGLMRTGPSLVSALFHFCKWIRQNHCDLIHVHHRRLAVLAHLLRPFTGVPVVFTGHLTFPCATWFRTFAPRIVTGVSPSVAEYLHRCTNARDISVIYNPFPFPEAVPVPGERNPRKVISVGRLEPVKDHATLIEAWGILTRTGVDAHLDIFGEGPLRLTLETLIKDRGLGDKVRLCGFTSNLNECLGSYGFNVLTSKKEGLPNVVVEAASRGIPSLLTDVDGSRDTLPSNLALENGIKFGDAVALSQALKQWLNSPEQVRTDGLKFYAHLKELCSPAAIGEQYTSLYARVVAAGSN